LFIIAACVVLAALNWDRIPEKIVTHYDFNGQADRTSAKTFGSVFMLNLNQLFLIGLFLFINYTIRMTKQQLDPANPKSSMEKQLKFRRISSFFMWGISLVIVAFMGYSQASMLYAWKLKGITAIALALPIFIIACLIGVIVYAMRKGLGQNEDSSAKDDRLWRLGGFVYFNKQDPSLFVTKRAGIGWTPNFGHPLSWVIMVGIIAVPLAIILISEGLS
jgi:uncharacterized membrane protein